MEDKDRRLLQKHAFRLQMDLTMDAVFLSLFETKCVFTDANIEAIMAKPTNSQRVSEFLIRLPKRGKTAFETLIHALMETGQDHIADDLDKYTADEWRVTNNVPTDKVELKKRPRTIKERGEPIISSKVLDVEEEVSKGRVGNDDNYNMINKIRGRALIINNSTWKGARFDEKNLRNLFDQLQFENSPPRTTTKRFSIQEFEDICNFVRLEQIHNLADAFIMVVMSPGTKDGICFRKDNNEPGDKKDEKSYDEIEAYFDGKQCRGLMDKPKLLIFHTYEKDADEGEVDSVFPNDNEDEVNSMNSSKKFEPTRTIHSDSNECSKTNDPRQSYKGSTSGSGQEEHAAKKSEAINAPSDQQKVTPSPKDDQKHIHEKTDICSVICHVSDESKWGDADKGSHFIRNLIFTFLERCHDDHWDEMMTEITNLEGSRGQPVTRKSTLKKSVYLLPGYYDKEFEREKEQKKTST